MSKELAERIDRLVEGVTVKGDEALSDESLL
jgi:hypothetical protein